MNKCVVIWLWSQNLGESSDGSAVGAVIESMSGRVCGAHDTPVPTKECVESLDTLDIDYGLVFGGTVTPDELKSLSDLLDQAEIEPLIPKRRRLLGAVASQINKILARPVGINHWAKRLVHDAGIDLPKRTIIFASTIEESERIRDTINNELASAQRPQRARATHYRDWKDHDGILLDFQLDSRYSILVMVRRLENIDRMPSVENIIFLSDHDRELFLKRIVWVPSEGRKHVFECAPSLDHALLVMNTQIDRKIERGECGGFAVHADSKDTRLTAFAKLVERYMSQMRTIRHVFSTADGWRSALFVHGVTDGPSLKRFGVVRFAKHFGASELTRFLGREIDNRGVRMEELRDLSIKLGWEMKIIESLGTDMDTIRTNLARQGISSGDALKQKGLSWFKSTFWSSDLGKVLGRPIRNSAISWTDLQELCTLIGWELVINDIPVRRPRW